MGQRRGIRRGTPLIRLLCIAGSDGNNGQVGAAFLEQGPDLLRLYRAADEEDYALLRQRFAVAAGHQRFDLLIPALQLLLLQPVKLFQAAQLLLHQLDNTALIGHEDVVAERDPDENPQGQGQKYRAHCD